MLYVNFNYYTISLLIGTFTALISGFVVIIHDYKRLENQAWFALTMCTAIWSSGYFYMTVASTHDQGFLGNWILHYAAIFIPLFYYILVLIITDTLKKYKVKVIIYTIIAFLFTSINLSPLFVSDVMPKVGFNFAPVPGPLYILFFLYFVLLVVDGLITTSIVAVKTNDKTIRARLWYTVIFTIAASVGGGSVFATTFLTVIPPYPIILFSIYPAISGYAILRYQLFDVRVVTAQIFTFTLWIFIFIRVLFSETLQDQVINVALLLITIIVGLLLNRSVKKEVKSREALAIANKAQSETMNFITHQIRGVFADTKAGLAALLDGDFGVVSDQMRNIVDKMFQTQNRGVSEVETFLKATHVENGTVEYVMKPFDFKQLVLQLSDQEKARAESKKLNYEMHISDGDYMLDGDQTYLDQVVSNLIDNAIRYTPAGSVEIALARKDDRVIFSVKDSGVGVNEEDGKKLFTKYGHGKDSRRINTDSNGLGLFIVKGIVDGHHGKIWYQSAGTGKGTTFFVELPIEQK